MAFLLCVAPRPPVTFFLVDVVHASTAALSALDGASTVLWLAAVHTYQRHVAGRFRRTQDLLGVCFGVWAVCQIPLWAAVSTDGPGLVWAVGAAEGVRELGTAWVFLPINVLMAAGLRVWCSESVLIGSARCSVSRRARVERVCSAVAVRQRRRPGAARSVVRPGRGTWRGCWRCACYGARGAGVRGCAVGAGACAGLACCWARQARAAAAGFEKPRLSTPPSCFVLYCVAVPTTAAWCPAGAPGVCCRAQRCAWHARQTRG
eukprot:TRINITY_DN7496_c0_g1_i2.p3 TRINITY_DN7496_c0_g1~~TRINITY_DN7496_c0_g1_i2.p3  ORF type:complete len:275 (+),score=26.13 TRINITY_DN7496_c0_g1_i2:40-825(+)